jgi:hypothetical protein
VFSKWVYVRPPSGDIFGGLGGPNLLLKRISTCSSHPEDPVNREVQKEPRKLWAREVHEMQIGGERCFVDENEIGDKRDVNDEMAYL